MAQPAGATDTPASAINQRACVVQPVTNSAGTIITPAMAATINQFEPLYKQAASSLGLSWLLVPPLHYRESNFSLVNPGNGQGLFQLSSSGLAFTPGQTVSAANLVSQAELALNVLRVKALPASLASGSNAVAAWAYFGYNGRALAYYQQAEAKGLAYPFEGSPYVYNLFDASETGLRLIQSDHTNTLGVVDLKPGTFTLYSALVQQCGSATVAAPAGATTVSAQTVANPFAGEVVPLLPPTGNGPAPLYALAGVILLAWLLIVAWRKDIYVSTLHATFWWAALLVVPMLFVHDELALAAWHYNPHWSALTLTEAIVGLLAAVGAIIAFKGWCSWLDTGSSPSSSRTRRVLDRSHGWNWFAKASSRAKLGAEEVDTDGKSWLWLLLSLLRIVFGAFAVAVWLLWWVPETIVLGLYTARWYFRLATQHLSNIFSVMLVMAAVYGGYHLATYLRLGVGVSYVVLPVGAAIVLLVERKQLSQSRPSLMPG
jgi:hypothetical protein